MRDLAKSRKADAKAEAAIPDWIREADKAKPAEHLDLGWRQVAPKRNYESALNAAPHHCAASSHVEAAHC